MTLTLNDTLDLKQTTRIQRTLHELNVRGEKAMGIFLTNGFPHPDATLPLLRTIDEAGADFIELGMPFSDPLAEGIPIQRSSDIALRNGITMGDAFKVTEAFRKNSDTPLLLMGYINPVFRYGISNFCRDAHSSGVDGLILPDLPAEESALIREAAHKHALNLVFLIAPNTPENRIRETDALASAFVYAVSMTGLTGADIQAKNAVAAYLQRARALVQQNPLLVGFGIKSHQDAMQLSRHTDGFIVGSAVINAVEALWNDSALKLDERLRAIGDRVSALKRGDRAHPGQVEPAPGAMRS